MEERSGTQGRRLTTGTGGSLPFRETDGHEALRAGQRVMEKRGTGKRRSEAGKPGGVKGGPGAESWSPIGFPSHQIRSLPFTCERASERRRTDGLVSPGAREVEMTECGVRSQ